MSPWIAVLATLGICMVSMALLWWWAMGHQQVAWVDVLWTLLVGGQSVFYALVLPGDEARRVVIATLVMLWSLRLTWHLQQRLGREKHDGRYEAMASKWGEQGPRRFLIFFQFQAMAAWAFGLLFCLIANSQHPWTALDGLGVGIWLIAYSGESLADWQLSRFKSDPENRGEVCREGLWRYSRHPNYFFEWLHWVSYAVLAWQGPWGPAGILAPAVMLYFILFVTGIPPAEQQALKSRPEKYRRYQETTSAFVPWIPRGSRETAV